MIITIFHNKTKHKEFHVNCSLIFLFSKSDNREKKYKDWAISIAVSYFLAIRQNWFVLLNCSIFKIRFWHTWKREVQNTRQAKRKIYKYFPHRFIKNLNYYFLKPHWLMCLRVFSWLVEPGWTPNTSSNEAKENNSSSSSF